MNIKQFVGVNSHFEKEDGTKITHREMYEQVVNAIGLDNCARHMPVELDQLVAAMKTEDELNSIPLKLWDEKHPYIRTLIHRAGIRVISLSDSVCTLKMAARMLVEREMQSQVVSGASGGR